MFRNRKAALFYLFMAGMLLSFYGFGQTNSSSKTIVKDGLPPKLMVKFGPYADSSKVLISTMKQIVKNELKVTDTKGTSYLVVAFSFWWKRKDITDDFKTGIPKTIFLYNSVDVKGDAHIPASWQKEINETLQSKEEIRFDDILVQNPKTKKLYKPAPLTLFIL